MRITGSRLWNSPTITTWGSFAVRAGGLLIVFPLVLRQFSAGDLAVWQLFGSIFTLSLLLDFGLSPTLARYLAYARGGLSVAQMAVLSRRPCATVAAGADFAAAASIVATMRWFYPRAGAVVMLAIAALGTLALWEPVEMAAHPMRAWVAWAVLLVGTYAALVGSAYAAALQGMDDIAVLRRWEVLTGVLQIGSAAGALALHADLMLLVVVYQFWTVVGALRNRSLLHRRHPELLARGGTRPREVLRLMWPAAWRSGIGVLLSQGVVQLSGLIYAQVADAEDLAAYLLALRLATTVSQFSQAPFYSKLPHLGALHARGAREEQIGIAQRGMRLSQAVLVTGYLVAGAAVPALLQGIGSKTPFVSDVVWSLLAIAFFVERFGAMHLQLYSLTNHIVWHIANGITGTLMLVVGWVAFPALGVAALPLAMLVAYGAFYSIFAITKSSRAFDFSPWRFEARAGAPSALVLCLGLVALLAWHRSGLVD